jgi:LuxR family maltose regulon positive regulatory protein
VLVRDRLTARLTTGATRPVTLVSAGPGWGKTMAAASWAASRSAREPVAWLGLDDADNNPESFWSNLVSAVIGSGGLRGRSPLRDQDFPGEFRVAGMDEPWAQLADLPGPVVLIIDDFQVITDGDVLERFGRLIGQPPSSPLRLILLSRADPVLPLHQLRARGDLTEVRAGDLAFTREETTDLFTGNALHLPADQAGRIMDRTKGWPAGVRAAALSIHPDDADAGVDHFCVTGRGAADDLVDEVLQAVSPADREFLLTTSVADLVSGALADQLTGRSDGRLVLERLFDGNVFTVRHGQNGWFSYQPLFRHLLTILRTLESPRAAMALPLRAAAAAAETAQPGAGDVSRPAESGTVARMGIANAHAVGGDVTSE